MARFVLGNREKTENSTMTALIFAALGSALVWNSVTHAANNLPDLLGLNRLDASLTAVGELDRSDPVPGKEAFMLKATGETSKLDSESPDSSRRIALDWLDEYASRQLLFQHSDMTALRKALTTIPEDQLASWLSDSHQLRVRLSDESWRATQQWLRDFLAAQAIYSPDQIATLRDRMATLGPPQLVHVLDHFEIVHMSRMRSRQIAQNVRPRQIITFGPPQTSARPSTRAAYFQGSDGFPSSAGTYTRVGSARDLYNVGRPSLSRRVASFYVYSGLFGGGYYGWFW